MENWSKDLAYCIGLLTTDGNLSSDGRHLELTSKDWEQIVLFKKLLGLKNKISKKKSTFKPEGIYYRIQFGNVHFYNFLLSIGLMPKKTKTVGAMKVPDEYFPDFLRGHIDGDGYTLSYWDSKYKKSFRLYTAFLSASKAHLEWLQAKINTLYGINGKIHYPGKSTYRLIFAKRKSVILLNNLYYEENIPCLKRKRLKIDLALGIIRNSRTW